MSSSNILEESDFGQQSVALKVMLPERLHNDLNLYAQHSGQSKTEVVRNAIYQLMDNTPIWKAKCFFFKPKNEVRTPSKAELLSQLESAPKGTLIKMAGLQVDAPDRASIFICNLIRVNGDMVSFDIPNNYRPTQLNASQLQDSDNIKMVSGELVLPLIDMVPSPFGGQVQRFIYTINVDYIWDIDVNAPSFIGYS